MTEPASRAALAPVTPQRIGVAADHGILNANHAAAACRKANLPFYAACAVLEKESHGANIYGHDDRLDERGNVIERGTFSTRSGPVTMPDGEVYPKGLNIPVTAENFFWFLVKVMNGGLSNGVNATQITYAGPLRVTPQGKHRDGGYFRQMADAGLRPWHPEDAMLFGFRILRGHYDGNGQNWVTAGRLYNGRLSYGVDLAEKIALWRARMREAR